MLQASLGAQLNLGPAMGASTSRIPPNRAATFGAKPNGDLPSSSGPYRPPLPGGTGQLGPPAGPAAAAGGAATTSGRYPAPAMSLNPSYSAHVADAIAADAETLRTHCAGLQAELKHELNKTELLRSKTDALERDKTELLKKLQAAQAGGSAASRASAADLQKQARACTRTAASDRSQEFTCSR